MRKGVRDIGDDKKEVEIKSVGEYKGEEEEVVAVIEIDIEIGGPPTNIYIDGNFNPTLNRWFRELGSDDEVSLKETDEELEVEMWLDGVKRVIRQNEKDKFYEDKGKLREVKPEIRIEQAVDGLNIEPEGDIEETVFLRDVIVNTREMKEHGGDIVGDDIIIKNARFKGNLYIKTEQINRIKDTVVEGNLYMLQRM